MRLLVKEHSDSRLRGGMAFESVHEFAAGGYTASATLGNCFLFHLLRRILQFAEPASYREILFIL